jgi:hypothetical protein
MPRRPSAGHRAATDSTHHASHSLPGRSRARLRAEHIGALHATGEVCHPATHGGGVPPRHCSLRQVQLRGGRCIERDRTCTRSSPGPREITLLPLVRIVVTTLVVGRVTPTIACIEA